MALPVNEYLFAIFITQLSIRFPLLADWIDEVRPGVLILESVHCSLPLEILLGVHSVESTAVRARKIAEEHGHDSLPDWRGTTEHRDHKHNHMFETWSYHLDIPLHLGLLQQLLSHLPKTMYRAKGFVYAAEKPHRRLVLQLVGRRATIAEDTPWKKQRPQTRLIFVAGSGTFNIPATEQALNGCQIESNERV